MDFGPLAFALRALLAGFIAARDPALAIRLVANDRTTNERPKLVAAALPTSAPSPVIEAPAGLIRKLEGDPFGPDCRPTHDAYFPFEARKCDYAIGARSFTVTIASPAPDRVATWIIDAARFVPRLRALEAANDGAWERVLETVARYTMNQSGRSFPLDGVVLEDEPYEFRGGVTFGVMDQKTRSCAECACRIVSLHRGEWCEYERDTAPKGSEAPSYEKCVSGFGGLRGWSDAWASQCLEIQTNAWESQENEGFRALLHFVDKHQLEPMLTTSSTNDEVADAFEAAFKTPHVSHPGGR